MSQVRRGRPWYDLLGEHHRQSLERLTERKLTGYAVFAETARERPDAARAALRSALGNDLRPHEPGSTEDGSIEARERAFYLLVALCGPKRSPATHLRVASQAASATYGPLLERLVEQTGRVFERGADATQRAISCYLEGVVLHGRFGNAPHPEEVEDTVMRLFLATTRPAGSPPVDPAAEIFGEAASP